MRTRKIGGIRFVWIMVPVIRRELVLSFCLKGAARQPALYPDLPEMQGLH